MILKILRDILKYFACFGIIIGIQQPSTLWAEKINSANILFLIGSVEIDSNSSGVFRQALIGEKLSLSSIIRTGKNSVAELSFRSKKFVVNENRTVPVKSLIGSLGESDGSHRGIKGLFQKFVNPKRIASITSVVAVRGYKATDEVHWSGDEKGEQTITDKTEATYQAMLHNYQKGDYESVLNTFSGSMTKFKDSSGRCEYLAGKSYLAQGKYDKAAPLFAHVSESATDEILRSDAMLSAGLACHSMHDYQRSSVFLTNYLKGNPSGEQVVNARYLRGLNSIRLGDVSFARSDFTYIIERYPDDPVASYVRDELGRLGK